MARPRDLGRSPKIPHPLRRDRAPRSSSVWNLSGLSPEDRCVDEAYYVVGADPRRGRAKLTGQCESQAGYPPRVRLQSHRDAKNNGGARFSGSFRSVGVDQLTNGDNAEAELHEFSAHTARIWVNPLRELRDKPQFAFAMQGAARQAAWCGLALSGRWRTSLRHERLLLLIAVIALGSIIGFAAGQLVTVFWSNAHRTGPARPTITPR
jgi:hypothetical protein